MVFRAFASSGRVLATAARTQPRVLQTAAGAAGAAVAIGFLLPAPAARSASLLDSIAAISAKVDALEAKLSVPEVMAHSCNPYGESLPQL